MVASWNEKAQRWQGKDGKFVSPNQTRSSEFSTVDMRELVQEIRALRLTVGGAIAKVGNATVAEQRKSRATQESKFYFWVNATCLGLAIATDLGVSAYSGWQNSSWSKDPLGSAASLFGGTSAIFEKKVEEGATIAGYQVSSGYGQRNAPIEGASTDHKGVDLVTPEGVALYMPGDGRVECGSQPEGAGTYATITPNDGGYTFRAFHLSNCAEGTLKEGQVFARTGNTGNSTGPHLHWEQLREGQHVQPTEGWLWWVLTGNPPVEGKTASASVDAASLDGEQKEVVGEILQVARQVGASRTDFEIAIATCLVESDCRELNHGDADSIGPFQQRPSQSWPNSADAAVQAQAFFKGSGTNPGLLSIGDRASRPGSAAQEVQRSAYPDRYDERMSEAKQIAAEILGGK